MQAEARLIELCSTLDVDLSGSWNMQISRRIRDIFRLHACADLFAKIISGQSNMMFLPIKRQVCQIVAYSLEQKLL